MIKNLIKLAFVFLVFFLLSCSNNKQKAQLSENSDYKIEIMNPSRSENADTITLNLLIRDKDGKKEIWHDWDGLTVTENNILMKSIMNEIKNPTIDSNVTFSLLVDRTIGQYNMDKMKNVVSQFIDNLPHNPVYISFFDEISTESKKVNKETFYGDFIAVDKKKNIYKAVNDKFLELSGVSDIKKYVPDSILGQYNTANKINEDILKQNDENHDNYLIILTDGKYYEEYSGSYVVSRYLIEGIDNDKNINEKTKIYILTYGQEEKDTLDLKAITAGLRKEDNKDIKGKYLKGDKVDDLLHDLFTITDDNAANYKIIIEPKKGKKYAGDPLEYQIKFANKEEPQEIAYGKGNIPPIGTLSDPVTVGGKPALLYVIGPIIGLLIIIVAFVLLQILIPYVNYLGFKKKYVKKYKPVSGEHSGRALSKICPWCNLEFEEGDDIVEKCKHTVHLECWEGKDRDKVFRYRCPVYPYCSKGHYYYNNEEKFDPDNALTSKNWIVGGLATGLIVWLLFQLLSYVCPNIFNSFASLFINTKLADGKQMPASEYITFVYKFRDMLFQGILLGFSLTFLFSWLIEFKEKKLSVVRNILLRSLVGAAIGFIAYFVGALIVIKTGISKASVVDGIPFLIFGATIGIILSYKTEIQLKNGIIGGVVGSVLGFIVLFFTANLFGSYSLLVAFMLNSAILGASIVMVHRIAENYYLRLSGERIRDGREIAIHKWMSALGGRNQVRIGLDSSCTIQMNWDRLVNDEEVVLFVNNDVPYCRAVTDGILFNGRPARSDQEIQLSNGINFTIGETTFTYIEKELPKD